jgi:hypothetical protein
MWENLKNLDEDLLHERLKPYVEWKRRKMLMTRRDKIVAHFQSLIESRGELGVL